MAERELLKEEIKRAYRMEMVGAGVYLGLARQHGRRNESLGRLLDKIARQEMMHADLYNGFYLKNYGSSLRGGWAWRLVGQGVAWAMSPLTLDEKLKRVQAAEQQMVKKLQLALTKEYGSDYGDVVRRILPDEMAHADRLVGYVGAWQATRKRLSLAGGRG